MAHQDLQKKFKVVVVSRYSLMNNITEEVAFKSQNVKAENFPWFS